MISGTRVKVNGETSPLGHPAAPSLLRPCLLRRPPKGTSHILTRLLFVDINDGPTSEKVKPNCPTEILCQIFQFVARSDGVKALLPLTHVDAQWRHAALGDSSLWTTVYLGETPLPLLGMTLARAGNRLFTVHVDCRAFGPHRAAGHLRALVNRIKELHYSAVLEHLNAFLAYLGPAPNLKILHFRPESGSQRKEVTSLNTFPIVIWHRFPLLRNLVLTNTVIWRTGLFRNLTSFECGIFDSLPISPAHVLDTIRQSPLIESLRLVGRCVPPQHDQPAIALPLLRKCTLVGDGTASLIRFITLPATGVVFLGKPYADDWFDFPGFNMHSLAPGLRSLGEVFAISFSIDDHTARLQARNDCGGVLDVEADGLYNLSGDPSAFLRFIQGSFECWPACAGLKTTRELTLRIERDGIWNPRDATNSAVNLVRLVSDLPDIEGAKFHGLPPPELSSILSLLTFPLVPTTKPRCPNLKRLEIESSPLCSPRLLLVELGKLLAARREAGIPLQSVTVKVNCERLMAATDHCALLTSWEGLVEGGVRLEYEQIEVKKLLWRSYGCYPEDDGDEEMDVEEDGEADTGGLGDCVGWDGWPGKWPKMVEEMKGQ